MALLNLGDDPWLIEYESCEKLSRDIMEQLNMRQKLSRSTDKYSQVSANVRLRLKQYNNEVNQLNEKLGVVTKAGSITAAESERRRRQLELLLTKGTQMQKIFDHQVVTKATEERNQLIGDSSAIWGEGSSYDQPNAAQYSVDQLRDDQRRILGEQDRGLENLSQIISRQKNIANTISNEVDLHNEILDDLGEHIDRTDARVRNETQNVTVVDRKDKTCIYWVVIILLFISIIAVAAV